MKFFRKKLHEFIKNRKLYIHIKKFYKLYFKIYLTQNI